MGHEVSSEGDEEGIPVDVIKRMGGALENVHFNIRQQLDLREVIS